MSQSVAKIIKIPANKGYLAGVGAGLALFIFMLGWRLFVVLTGSAIALISIVYWFWKNQSSPSTQAPSSNLLQADVFLDYLACFQKQISVTRLEVWAVVQTQANSIQTNAAQIALRESVLIPDLLETLHSTLDLTEQIAEALHLLDQMQTPQYQTRIQQRLQESLERLQATQSQLQTLNDQFAYEKLEQRSHYTSALAAGLRILVSENEQVCK
jgi:L-fucose mutarotase/ribose pyranase (RbsD/FucU family)